MTDEAQISERERDILRLVATGATNQQIAQQLNISINTVKVHLRNIFGKIGVVSRTEATLYAVRAGLVTVERTGGATAVADEPEEPPPPPVSVVALTPPVVESAPSLVEPGQGVAESVTLAPLATLDKASEPVAPLPVPQSPPLLVPQSPSPPFPSPAARNPLVIGLALVTLLAVGALIAVLLRPTAPAVAPTVGGVVGLGQGERWRVLAPLPAARANFAMASANVGGSSYLYAIGGETAGGVSGELLRYDPAGDSWARYTAKPTPVADANAVVIGGRLYVPGGRTAAGAATDVLEVYDPQTDTWATRAPLLAPRSRYALAAVEGKLYLFGGWNDGAFAREVYQYTPDTDTWAELTPMEVPRANAGAAVFSDQIFLVGGENESGPLARHERYTPAAEAQGNPWTIRAPLPAPRSGMAIAEASDRIFLIGGGGEALVYSSSRDSWQQLSGLPLDPALSGARAEILSTSEIFLYLVGGRGPSDLSDQAYEYLALYLNSVPLTSQ